MTKKLIVLSLAFALSMGMVSLVYAEDSADTVTTDDTSAEVSTEVDTDVPSGFGLWLQDVRERVSLMFTFDPVKKAEKQVMFAERRMDMAERLVANESEAVQARGQHMIERAEEYMARVEERKDKWIEKSQDRADKIANRIGNYQERREQIMDVLENTVPEERGEAIRALREEFSAQGTRLMNALENEHISDDVREHLQEVKTRIEDHAEEVKEYREEVRTLLQENKPADVAPELQQLREERRERVETRVQQDKEMMKKQLHRDDNDDEEEDEDDEDDDS